VSDESYFVNAVAALGHFSAEEIQSLAEGCPPEMVEELKQYLATLDAVFGLVLDWRRRAVAFQAAASQVVN
jgi:hypothetical protein